MALGAVIFFVFFRLWAYYHVVRQHWGFFGLYKRKADDFAHHRLDTWFFNTTMYAPLVLFLTSPFYPNTPGFTNLGLHAPIIADYSIAVVVHPLAWLFYAAVVFLYLVHQFRIWRQKSPLNASKLLYMALIAPLHLAAFSHPVTAVFIVPLVTVGHNIQYLCIVYIYGRKKYSSNTAPQFPEPACSLPTWASTCWPDSSSPSCSTAAPGSTGYNLLLACASTKCYSIRWA